METLIKLELPEDFVTICNIFEIKMEQFIQKIVDEISLPRYYSGQREKETWSTLILLEHLDTLDFNEEEFAVHEPYMERLHATVSDLSLDSEQDILSGEISARAVMAEWHKAILAHRAKYLLDGLDGNG